MGDPDLGLSWEEGIQRDVRLKFLALETGRVSGKKEATLKNSEVVCFLQLTRVEGLNRHGQRF
jgi:hypothetical protein